MYVIIGGAGDAGRYLAKVLTKDGHQVAIIDRDLTAVEKAKEIDALVIQGDVLDFKTLLKAGIVDSDFYIGLVKEDSANLVSCSLASSYNTNTIARVKSSELAEAAISRKYSLIGVDMILCPSLIVSSQISRIFSFPSRIKIVKKHNIGIYQSTIEEDSTSIGKKMSSLSLPGGVKIVSVFRGVNQFLPTNNLILQAQDELCLFMDERVKIKDIEEKLDCSIDSYDIVNTAFIAGASDVGLTLSTRLVQSNISVSLMIQSQKKAEDAAKKLRNISVIHGDPLGHDILKKEGIEQFDVLLSLGNSVERNIFISLVAKQFNVPKAITLINRIDLKESIEGTLIDHAIVPNLLLNNTILNILKKRHEINGRSRKRRAILVRSLQTKDILLKKIDVTSKMRCVDKDIGFFTPETGNFLVPCVSKKDGKGFIPDKNYRIKKGDRLFVLFHSTDEKSVKRWLIG